MPREIGAWSRWQGNLNADLMIVAQDWGSQKDYIKQGGWDESIVGGKLTITNQNLICLMGSIGRTLRPPEEHEQEQHYFFTNTALCMRRSNSSSGGAKSAWFSNCRAFLRCQIDIVNPKVIVTLGKVPFDNVLKALDYDFDYGGMKFKDVVDRHEPITVRSGMRLVPVFHCGLFGVNVNRRSPDRTDVLQAHSKDWETVKKCLDD